MSQEELARARPANAAASAVGRLEPMPLPAETMFRGTRYFEVDSVKAGARYAVWVTTPMSYDQDPSRSFPAIYTPDGNGAALLAPRLSNAGAFDPINSVMSSIQISVGYPKEDIARTLAVRARDLLPPHEALRDGVEDGMPELVKLGLLDQAGADLYLYNLRNPAADRFLAFLSEELHPFIAETYRVQTDTVGLFGHSYGGLFATYAALQPSTIFKNIGASSPGILGGKSVVFKLFADALQSGGLSERNLHMMLATREITVPGLYQFMVGQGAVEFIRTAGAAPLPGLNFTSRLIEDESHTSVDVPAMYDFLRRFYSATA